MRKYLSTWLLPSLNIFIDMEQSQRFSEMLAARSFSSMMGWLWFKSGRSIRSHNFLFFAMLKTILIALLRCCFSCPHASLSILPIFPFWGLLNIRTMFHWVILHRGTFGCSYSSFLSVFRTQLMVFSSMSKFYIQKRLIYRGWMMKLLRDL